MTRKRSLRRPDPDLAALLNEIRKHFGKSQDFIARRTGYERSMVSLVETAKRQPTSEIFSVYLHLTREDPAMRRRLLLAAAAAGLTGALVPDDAIADTITRVVRPDIDAWDARLAAFGRDNMQFGSAIMRDKIKDSLVELVYTPHNGALGTHLAKLTMLYARTEPTGARALNGYTSATTVADNTGNPTTIAWTYGRAALAAGGDASTADDADAFAHRAISVGRTGDSLADIGIYMAYAALARGHANAGDHEGTLKYCEDAMRAYEHIDPDDDGSEYTYSSWRHAITISYPMSLIGHPDADIWSNEAYRLGATGRFDTHLQLHEAIRRWRDGDPDAADTARSTMAAANDDQTTLILRTMAAQAGASEYAPSPSTADWG